QFSEGLPQLARRADRLTVVRSFFHEAAPIHETGLQLLQTGRLVTNGVRYPSMGTMVARLLGGRGSMPAHVLLPRPHQQTGVEMYRGDGAGFLGDDFAPWMLEADVGDSPGDPPPARAALPAFEDQPIAVRERYGDSRSGRQLSQARQLIERGVRFVTVNMFDRLEHQVTWDAHAGGASPGTLFDYRDSI